QFCRSVAANGDVFQSFWKISSILRPNTSAILKASGSDGSYLPFSMALTELRETSSSLARSAWVQPFSARRTRMRFFIASPLGDVPADPAHEEADRLACRDVDRAEQERFGRRIGGRTVRRRERASDPGQHGLKHAGLEQHGEEGERGKQAEEAAEHPGKFL